MPITYTAIEDIKAGQVAFVNDDGRLEKYADTPAGKTLERPMEASEEIQSISLLDWINEIERPGFALDCCSPSLGNLKDFKIIPSNKAYESYSYKKYTKDYIVINNVITVESNLLWEVKSKFKNAMYAHVVAAYTKKLEGYPLGGGVLIIQDRMPIMIHKHQDGTYKMMWYGCFDRVNSNLILENTACALTANK